MPTLDVVIDVEYSLIAHVSVVCIVILSVLLFFFFFFFNDPAPPEIYPLPLHDALPILLHTASVVGGSGLPRQADRSPAIGDGGMGPAVSAPCCPLTVTSHPEVTRRRVHLLPQRRCPRSEEHTSELQSQSNVVCRLLLEK